MLYLVSTDMYMLINYVSFVNWLAIGLSVVALLYFRYTRPNMNRPIKVRFSQVLILLHKADDNAVTWLEDVATKAFAK